MIFHDQQQVMLTAARIELAEGKLIEAFSVASAALRRPADGQSQAAHLHGGLGLALADLFTVAGDEIAAQRWSVVHTENDQAGSHLVTEAVEKQPDVLVRCPLAQRVLPLLSAVLEGTDV